ncbi:ABC-three component system middle component 2 [Azospirillum sp. TSH64]|uniref:ABC-three component system middle component 2 n=1 Tax=Azospirillum sp. TSH64 TaxID=652740 RepID=UPI000D612F83|nr:ABC-three component system middle component 2 [Azospirillum sp. TSH64]PWC74508.1 threonine transporter [Azospirillum sp. TSH64]
MTGRPQTYNGPLEAGVRAVAVLTAIFPQALDLHWLTMLDYLLTHTGELGGPENIHPPSPIQAPATEVRRKLVQKALMLMMTRDLVTREVSANGIRYAAGDSAVPFLDGLRSPYMVAIKERAVWLAEHLGEFSNAKLDAFASTSFDRWVAEFQAIEQSLGGDA